MFLVATNIEDLQKRYLNNTHRRLGDKYIKMYSFRRQPRPHMNLDMYVNRRCALIQLTKPTEIVMDYKTTTLRKVAYNAFRTSLRSGFV